MVTLIRTCSGLGFAVGPMVGLVAQISGSLETDSSCSVRAQEWA